MTIVTPVDIFMFYFIGSVIALIFVFICYILLRR